MKIALNTVITTLKGEAYKDGPGDDAPDLTLRAVIGQSCANSLPNDEQMTGAKKAEIGALAVAMYATDPVTNDFVDSVDLKAEQVTLIKERVAKGWPPLIVARAWELLDPPAKD